MPRILKWSDIKDKTFFSWLRRRMRMRVRRIQSRVALRVFRWIWPMIHGRDILQTPYGRLLELIGPHIAPNERNPAETLERIIRERASARHQLQRQQETIQTQQETVSMLVSMGVAKLEAEVDFERCQKEAATRPTAWQRLDEDDL